MAHRPLGLIVARPAKAAPLSHLTIPRRVATARRETCLNRVDIGIARRYAVKV
jgi:hypothetical protein